MKIKTINVKLNKFKLPICIEYDNMYYKVLNDTFIKYINHIDNVQELDSECKNKTKYNCKKILECVADYYNANIIKAQKKIEQIIKQYIKSDFIVSQIDENYAFRGIAPQKLRPNIYSDYNEKIYNSMMKSDFYFFRARIGSGKFNRNDMLHIPFNKRSKTSTERYSIPGVPCLYLSSTSYGTWREMNQPSPTDFNVSAYLMPPNLKILNLCLSQHLINGAATMIESEQEQRNLEEFIQIFPLVISTSFSVSEDKRKFKSEHIVS